MLLKILVHYIQVLCQSRLCKADHVYLTYLMLQRQLSHLNGCKLDRRLNLTQSLSQSHSYELYDGQSVPLGNKPPETNDQYFFNLTLAVVILAPC
jgi:hypothetical protein